MNQATFSVIIVSWNVKAELRECLLSLRKEITLQAEVIVVDNASGDGTVDLVKEFPEVLWQLQNCNLGFARACNIGAKTSTGNILIFLNPDTRVGLNFFNTLEYFLNNHPRAQVVGGKILNSDGTLQPSVRALPSIWSGVLDSLKILGRMPQLAKKYLQPDFDYEKEQKVEQVMGAGFIVRRDFFEKLNGFDERFFVWFEEVDFCLRTLQAGGEVWYTPNIQIEHSQGKSFKQYSYFRRHFNFSKSLWQYIKKHKGLSGSLVILVACMPWFVLAPIFDVFKNIRKHVRK